LGPLRSPVQINHEELISVWSQGEVTPAGALGLEDEVGEAGVQPA
jgi:hypothetical protein